MGCPGGSRPSHHEHASPHREQCCKKGRDAQVSTMQLDDWTNDGQHTLLLRITEMLILHLWTTVLFVPVFVALLFPEYVHSSSGYCVVVYLQLRYKQAYIEINWALLEVTLEGPSWETSLPCLWFHSLRGIRNHVMFHSEDQMIKIIFLLFAGAHLVLWNSRSWHL